MGRPNVVRVGWPLAVSGIEQWGRLVLRPSDPNAPLKSLSGVPAVNQYAILGGNQVSQFLKRLYMIS